MGADPETFLGKLEPGREHAAGAVRGLGAVLDELVQRGWLVVRADGKKKLVALTADGVARRAELATAAPPPKPARARKASPPPDDRLDRALAILAELVERVARIEAAVGATAPAAQPTDLAPLKDAVLGTVADLDARGRLGGLVPIPDLRAALRERGLADDAAVTAALEQLEREWRIDLNVAQAPTAVADRAAGIERPGRGLLYYVSRRQA